MNNLSELETGVQNARDAYNSSKGDEWVRLVITLKALHDTYTAENRIVEAINCKKELDSVLEYIKEKFNVPLFESKKSILLLTYIKDICYWTNKVEECKKTLEHGGSPVQFAKTVNALCEFLCLTKLHDIALIQYEEVLHILLPTRNVKNNDRNTAYMIIVILLKSSICARETGNETLSKKYSIYPLMYIAEHSEEIANDTYFDWQYVAELCKELID